MTTRNVPTTLGIIMANILLSSVVVQHNPFLIYAPSCSGENSANELSKKNNHLLAYDKSYCHFICHIGTILVRKDHSDKSIKDKHSDHDNTGSEGKI